MKRPPSARRPQHRWRVVLPLALLALLLTPSVALGVPPKREALPPPASIEAAAGEVCAFPVLIEFLDSKNKALTFTDKSGTPVRQIITGKLRARVTNLVTEESLVMNISGPAFLSFTEEGRPATVTLGGRALLILRAGIDVAPPGVFLTSGRVVLAISFTIDKEAGEVAAIVSQTGRMQDLCTVLAS